MTPGEPEFRECPQCQTLLMRETLASGNTFGATYWTDGKRDAPMLPEIPSLVRCAKCLALVWLPDAKEFKPETPVGRGGRLEGAIAPIKPSERDYLEALSSGISPEHESYFRTKAWQTFNDAYRRANTDEIITSDEMMANMKELFSMLNEDDPNQRAMKAELAREMGDFSRAQQLLEYNFEEGFATAVNLIKNLAASGDKRVAQITQ